jgi:hypothetical protein
MDMRPVHPLRRWVAGAGLANQGIQPTALRAAADAKRWAAGWQAQV